MRYLEKRIAVLESRDKNPAWFVWRNSGETIDEAVARVGGGGIGISCDCYWLA